MEEAKEQEPMVPYSSLHTIQKKTHLKRSSNVGPDSRMKTLKNSPKRMKKHQIPHRHPRVQSTIEAEVWFEPKIVIETKEQK